MDIKNKKTKPKKRKRIGKPMSFRFTEEALYMLRYLANADLRSMASMLELLIREEYERKNPNINKGKPG